MQEQPTSDPSTSVNSEAELASDAERARRMHERSGEIELLISGALLFSLIQVPSYLSAVVDGLIPRLNESQFMIVFFTSFYVKLMVMTLIASFGLHLVARAYWVGLIGLDSVYPEGVDWSRIKYGPWAKEVYRERLPALPRMARRADDFGSTIFSFAFWIIVLFAFSIVAGGAAGGIWFALRATVLPGLSGNAFFGAVLVIAMIPTIAIGIDKVLAERGHPTGRISRAVQRTLSVAYHASGGPLFMPIQFTLFSRVPKKIIWPLFLSVFIALMFGILTTEFTRLGTVAVSSSEFTPLRGGPRSMRAAHFADTREPNNTAPYIQSDIVRDPYVKLTIPLVALRMNDQIGQACPGLEPPGRAGLTGGPERTDPVDAQYEAALLSCLGRIWTVQLNGTQLALEWDLVWSGGVTLQSVVAYLPTADLERGAHVLEITEIPRRGGTAEERAEQEASGEQPPKPSVDYIRFRL